MTLYFPDRRIPLSSTIRPRAEVKKLMKLMTASLSSKGSCDPVPRICCFTFPRKLGSMGKVISRISSRGRFSKPGASCALAEVI